MDSRLAILFALLLAACNAAQCPTCGIFNSRFQSNNPMLASVGDQFEQSMSDNPFAPQIMRMGSCPGQPATCSSGEYCVSWNFRVEMAVTMSSEAMSYEMGLHQAFMGCMTDILDALSQNSSDPGMPDFTGMDETTICLQMKHEACQDTGDMGQQEGLTMEMLCDFKCGDWQIADSIIDLPFTTYVVLIIFDDLPWLAAQSSTGAGTTTEASTTPSATGRARRSATISSAEAGELEDQLAGLYEDTDGFLSVKVTEITDNGDGTYNVQFEIYFSSLNSPDQTEVETQVNTFIAENEFANQDQTPQYTFKAAKESSAAIRAAAASALVIIAIWIAFWA